MLELFDFYPSTFGRGLSFCSSTPSFQSPVCCCSRRCGAAMACAWIVSMPPAAPCCGLAKSPRKSSTYTIAYLQRGLVGVTETIIAMAHSCGALKPVPESPQFLWSLDPSTPAHPILSQFLLAIRPKEGDEVEAATIKAEAQATARAYKSEIEKRARAAGMIRSDENRNRVYSAGGWADCSCSASA